MDVNPLENQFPEDISEQLNIQKIEDLPDGSSIYAIEAKEEIPNALSYQHDVNLAQFLNEGELKLIATELFENIQQDIDSRSAWQIGYSEGIKYLGIIQNSPNSKSRVSDAYDSTLLNALLRFCSVFMAEFFPPTGVASYDVTGGPTSPELEQYGELQKSKLNDYLRITDKGYYKDAEKMAMPLGLGGTIFKKVFNDPLANLPRSRFIKPQDLIINNQCKSLLESTRITEVVYFTKKEILERENNGFFISSGKLSEYNEDDSEFNQEQVDETIKKIDGLEDDYDKSSLFRYFESHAQVDFKPLLDLERENPNHPLPYIFYLCSQTRKIVAIYRNWTEGDFNYMPDPYYVQFNYFTGLGLYAYGILHLLGNNAKALTIMLRQQIDNQTIRNFPMYFLSDVAKTEHNTINMEPGEGIKIQTGGLPVVDMVSLIPFAPADPGFRELYNSVQQKTEQTGSIADIKLAETSPNAPVGTTVALLEAQNKFQSSVMRSLYESLTEELNLLYTKLIPVPTDPNELELYNRIKIIPACDPSFSTVMQRVVKSEAMFRYAQTDPSKHNMREVYRRVYLSMGIDNVEDILLSESMPVGLDPITENMNALNNKPLQAELWQDHESHRITHNVFLQSSPNMPPEVSGSLTAHIRQHEAFEYLLQMQMLMNIEMPTDMDQLRDPRIQNAIAMKAAEAALQQQSAIEQQRPPEPTEVMAMDVEQKREAAYLKASSDERRAEVDSFRAQLDFNKEMEKLKIEEKLAEEKNDTQLELERIKHQHQTERDREKINE